MSQFKDRSILDALSEMDRKAGRIYSQLVSLQCLDEDDARRYFRKAVLLEAKELLAIAENFEAEYIREGLER